MPKNIKSLLLCLLTLSFIIIVPACHKEEAKNGNTYQTYTIAKGTYKLKSEALASINGNPNELIKNAGKIYIKDQYIFLNEVDKGIHIFDNSNPSHPRQIAFLNIPGNLDMAVKGNTLYADMYTDLLSLDISDPRHVTLNSVLPGLFIERSYVYGNYIDSSHVIVDWIKKDTTVLIANQFYNPNCAACMTLASSATSSGAKSGTAGSMAKMVLMNNYLYAISERHSLSVIDISNQAVPLKASDMFAGFDLETIYPFEDKLFLGSAIGMFMFNVSTDPVHPVSIGSFQHGRACDPVITDGNYAYVTLHSGSQCGGSSNELDVIDIRNIQQASLVRSYNMTSPKGLSKDGNLLFICDGSDGVKLYDGTNPASLKLLMIINSKEPYDVIAANKIALVVAKDGLYQYDYSNRRSIHLLSFIATK